MAHHRTLSRMAAEFTIWRAAKSVDWGCTMQDLAGETGFSYDQVRQVCKRKGWTEKLLSGRDTPFGDRRSVDLEMKHGDGQFMLKHR